MKRFWVLLRADGDDPFVAMRIWLKRVLRVRGLVCEEVRECADDQRPPEPLKVAR